MLNSDNARSKAKFPLTGFIFPSSNYRHRKVFYLLSVVQRKRKIIIIITTHTSVSRCPNETCSLHPPLALGVPVFHWV